MTSLGTLPVGAAEAVAPTPPRHRRLVTGVLLALAAWALYWPTLRYDFVYYDDVRILKDHPELYGQPSLSADLKSIFVTCFPREEPLLVRDLTWAVDSRLFGFGNPIGYHLGNLILHGLDVALVFTFLVATTRRYGFALTTAVAYLLLAIHTEPVAWIMGRKDLLAALFMLLALCAQTRRLNAKTLTAQWAWFVASLALLAAGLLSKISVLTFPLMLFLHAVFFPYLRADRAGHEPLDWQRIRREALLLVPGLALSGFIYAWYQRILAQMGIFERGYSAHGLAHLWNLLRLDPLALWVYLRQVFAPMGLSVLYSWPSLQSLNSSWQSVAAVGTAAAVAGTGLWLFGRRKDLFFFYSAFLAMMVPYLNLVYIGIWVADRYAYLSVFCLLAIATSAVTVGLRSPRKLVRWGALAATAIFAITNLCQKLSYEMAWRDGESLWQHHIARHGSDPAAYENLAAYYYARFTAVAAQGDLPRMNLLLNKMQIVVEAGLAEVWPNRRQPPPPQAYYLFFLQSIVQEVNGQPSAALESLLTSDRLRPGFDATDLNLARLYRTLAIGARDASQKEEYARAARERFEEYIELAFRGRPAPASVREELAQVQAESLAAEPAAAGHSESGATPQ